VLKRGHPLQSQSINLEIEFQKLYNKKISAESAARVLVTDRKTAYKYYKRFSNQIHALTMKTLFSEGVNRMKQQISSYDNLLLELYDSLDSINQQMDKKSKDGIPQYLQNQKISIIREIKNMIKEKAAVELDIPTHNTTREFVEEVISERAKF